MISELHNELTALLSPFCRRLKWRRALHEATLGLAVGGVVAVLAGVCRMFTGSFVSAVLSIGGLVVVSAAPLLAGLWTMLRKASWQQAARMIDQRQGLKDRTVTAWQFASAAQPTVPQQLQIRDALLHLKRITAKEVVPLTIPRRLPRAVGLLVLSLCLLLWPRAEEPADAAASAAVDLHPRQQLATAPALEVSPQLATISRQRCRIDQSIAIAGPSEPEPHGRQVLLRNYLKSVESRPGAK